MTTNNMTPERARELLDMANRGETDGQRPVTVAANHAPLAEAAPALAELVANMHCEYAIQEISRGWYLREREDGKLVQVADPSDADWWYEQDACSDYVRWLNTSAGYNVRVVRRLVSDPEVVE